ncbi:MAG: phytoene/squalene synthetase [Alphaproteobacteria bacterium]|nr:phytoene/squalene synthetase [Alphaproteobacteria bacterium]
MARKHDPGRFLLSLFAPAERREDLWSLIAFNHEIAKTREVVTETQLGLIRLQWWRDALAGVYDGKPVLKHQVVEPLAEAIRRHDLPRELFEALIFAREFDLEDRAPATLEGMANYADFTATPLLKLWRRVTGAGDMPEDELIAAGTAYALTGLLRAAPVHLHQRRCYLPEDLLKAQGLDPYMLYDGKGLDKLAPVVKAVTKRARQAAEKSPGFLSTRMARMYLAQIEKAQCNLLSSSLQAPPPFMALRLWWAARFSAGVAA